MLGSTNLQLFAEDSVRGLDLLGGGFCFFISKLGKMDPFGLVVQPPASLTWNVKTLFDEGISLSPRKSYSNVPKCEAGCKKVQHQ